MKEVVLVLDVHDDKAKKKAMEIVSGISGVKSVGIDMEEKKLTVTGDVDPVHIVSKLRKLCHTEIVSVGPAKKPEKKKEKENTPPINEAYNHHMTTCYYYPISAEEDPNACVIC